MQVESISIADEFCTIKSSILFSDSLLSILFKISYIVDSYLSNFVYEWRFETKEKVLLFQKPKKLNQFNNKGLTITYNHNKCLSFTRLD